MSKLLVVGSFTAGSLRFLSDITQAAPAAFFSNPRLYFTSTSESLHADIADGFDSMELNVSFMYAGHKFQYNDRTGVTEFVVFMRPVSQRNQVIAFADYAPGFTPYFVWILDPMQNSRVRSFCNQLGYALYQSGQTLTARLSVVDDTDVLYQTFNTSCIDVPLPRV